MATPVQKAFTTDVGEMQRRRHHMTACGSSLVIHVFHSSHTEVKIKGKYKCIYIVHFL